MYGFIRLPFFIEGMLLGMLGSIVPITAILGGYYYIEQAIGEQTSYSFIDVLPYNPFAWLLSLFILIIGAFIGIWGSVMSVRKFLKRSEEHTSELQSRFDLVCRLLLE